MVEAGSGWVKLVTALINDAYATSVDDRTDAADPSSDRRGSEPPLLPGQHREEELVVLAAGKGETERSRARKDAKRGGDRQAAGLDHGADAARARHVPEIL